MIVRNNFHSISSHHKQVLCPDVEIWALWTFPNIYPSHQQLVLTQFPEEISVVTGEDQADSRPGVLCALICHLWCRMRRKTKHSIKEAFCQRDPASHTKFQVSTHA